MNLIKSVLLFEFYMPSYFTAVIFVLNFIVMGLCTLDFTLVAASQNQVTGKYKNLFCCMI